MSRRLLIVGLVVALALIVTAGIAYAAGVGSVNNGTDSAADGDYSVVGGGLENIASGYAATVSGGQSNRAAGDFSFVGGGGCVFFPDEEDPHDCFPGGSNVASGNRSVVVGGIDNLAEGGLSFIGGGRKNLATGALAVVVGGGEWQEGENMGNFAAGNLSTVLNGENNGTLGDFSTVLNGIRNYAYGRGSVILNGFDTEVHGELSVVAGGGGAEHDHSFVWRGHSQRDGEFVVSAYGGVRMDTGGVGFTVDGQDVLALIQSQQATIEALEARIAALESGGSNSPQPIQPGPTPEPSPVPTPSPTPTPVPSGSFEWHMEAENGRISNPFRIFEDSNASGGAYIAATSTSPTSSPKKAVSYSFSVPEDGTYYLWARLYGPDLNSDAIYIGIDGSWARMFPESTGQWLWTRVGVSRRNINKHDFVLSKGNHEINVGHAEPGARLDALFLTDDANARP